MFLSNRFVCENCSHLIIQMETNHFPVNQRIANNRKLWDEVSLEFKKIHKKCLDIMSYRIVLFLVTFASVIKMFASIWYGRLLKVKNEDLKASFKYRTISLTSFWWLCFYEFGVALVVIEVFSSEAIIMLSVDVLNIGRNRFLLTVKRC